MGKITVIKSLAILKLVYPMSVLPKPSEEILNLLQKLFRKFIWGTSKPRMTLSQLEQDILEGGLKLTNLLCLNYALKLAWIKRTFIKCDDWQTILENLTDMEKKSDLGTRLLFSGVHDKKNGQFILGRGSHGLEKV